MLDLVVMDSKLARFWTWVEILSFYYMSRVFCLVGSRNCNPLNARLLKLQACLSTKHNATISLRLTLVNTKRPLIFIHPVSTASDDGQ